MKEKTLKLFLGLMIVSIVVPNLALAEDAKKAAAEEALGSDSLAKANSSLEAAYGAAPKAQVDEGVNLAVAAGTEEAKKLEEAAKEAAASIPVNPAWEGKEPKVEIVKWGAEYRIKVKMNPSLKSEKLLAVKSVKLETVKGEFLGLKTYAEEEKTRDAEFMVNADILKIDAVKITVTSSGDGSYGTIAPLKVTEAPEVKKEAAAAAAKVTEGAQKASAGVEKAVEKTEAAAAAPAEKPKKKKGWW